MPRPRKTTAQHELSGATKKNPQRFVDRANEPEPNGEIGDPPAYFDEEEAAIWHELVGEVPAGVLTKADRTLFELACRLKRKMRVIPGRTQKWLNTLGDVFKRAGIDDDTIREMKSDIRSAIGMSSQDASLLASLLARMGLTPADRSRVSVPKKPNASTESDPIAAFSQQFGDSARRIN